MDLLPEAWGWGTILRTPTPKKHPRDTLGQKCGVKAAQHPLSQRWTLLGVSLETPCAEGVRLDTALLVVGVTRLGCGVTLPKGHCQGHLCLSWLGYTGILLPRVPLFKGQDWGDPFSWGSI